MDNFIVKKKDICCSVKKLEDKFYSSTVEDLHEIDTVQCKTCGLVWEYSPYHGWVSLRKQSLK